MIQLRLYCITHKEFVGFDLSEYVEESEPAEPSSFSNCLFKYKPIEDPQ